jgi:hypothetical protein
MKLNELTKRLSLKFNNRFKLIIKKVANDSVP